MSTLPITNPNFADGETRVNIYGYMPWRGLGITAVVVFALGLVAHSVYAVAAGVRHHRHSRNSSRFGKTSASKETQHSSETNDGDHSQPCASAGASAGVLTFEVLFGFGCAFELVGYGFRTASSTSPYKLTYFVLNYFMIVVGPVFFSAALYYCLALLLQLRKGYDSVLPISGRTLVRVFVIADVVTIITQIVGAALTGVSYSKIADGVPPPLKPSQANDILRAGLAVQVFSFTVYLALLFTVLVKRARQPDFAARQWRETTLLTTLAVTSILIYLRTFFRLAEAAEGVMSSSMRNQGLFASLETVPVIVVALVWALLPLTFLLK